MVFVNNVYYVMLVSMFSFFVKFWAEMKVNGVSVGKKKNEAPEMFENVFIFGGQNNPAEGMFRNLVFSSQHGKLSQFYC